MIECEGSSVSSPSAAPSGNAPGAGCGERKVSGNPLSGTKDVNGGNNSKTKTTNSRVRSAPAVQN